MLVFSGKSSYNEQKTLRSGAHGKMGAEHMGYYNPGWDDLGRDIQEIIDRAVNSRDYQKLNQTIRKAVSRAADMGGEAVRRAVDAGSRYADEQSQKRKYTVEPRPLPALYGNVNHHFTTGVLKVVAGSILLGFSFVGTLGLSAVGYLFGSFLFDRLALLGLAGMGCGGVLLISGVQTLGMVRRFRAYCEVLGEKTHCTLEKLARRVGRNVKFVRKEVVKMIDAGLFPEGHLDNEQVNLITSDEAYRDFECSRRQLEERMQKERSEARTEPGCDPQVRQVLDRGNAFIARIRKCNDDIPGEEISAKIDHMENLVQRIFARAESHPEVVPDLQRLMDYYLPMTVKLLEAYAEMDAQPVQGENIQGSKREIEETLDTLNTAFENLLDDLFRDAAMDVSSDISVLQTLLAQEGLTEDELSKMKKEI